MFYKTPNGASVDVTRTSMIEPILQRPSPYLLREPWYGTKSEKQKQKQNQTKPNQQTQTSTDTIFAALCSSTSTDVIFFPTPYTLKIPPPSALPSLCSNNLVLTMVSAKDVDPCLMYTRIYVSLTAPFSLGRRKHNCLHEIHFVTCNFTATATLTFVTSSDNLRNEVTSNHVDMRWPRSRQASSRAARASLTHNWSARFRRFVLAFAAR